MKRIICTSLELENPTGFHEVLFINIGFPMQEDLDVTKVLFFFQNETM